MWIVRSARARAPPTTRRSWSTSTCDLGPGAKGKLDLPKRRIASVVAPRAKNVRLSRMGVSFFDKWRKAASAPSALSARSALSAASVVTDPEGVAELLSECELLRVQAADAG